MLKQWIKIFYPPKLQKEGAVIDFAAKDELVQLYRFAEFGRIASGLFHDLVIPLNVISLNLEELNRLHFPHKMSGSKGKKKLLYRALQGTKRVQSYIVAARKHIQNQDERKNFSLVEEAKEIIAMLNYKAKGLNVIIRFSSREDIKLNADPIKFDQILSNLISNAIDSYESVNKNEKRVIKVAITQKYHSINLIIQDNGCGIPPKNMSRIFDALFTTKNKRSGTGLGLLITREIVERDFGGTIRVKSRVNKGTLFKIKIPLIDSVNI